MIQILMHEIHQGLLFSYLSRFLLVVEHRRQKHKVGRLVKVVAAMSRF